MRVEKECEERGVRVEKECEKRRSANREEVWVEKKRVEKECE